MKSTILLASAFLSSPCGMVSAFTIPTTTSSVSTKQQPLHATLTADELSTMSKSEQLKILGIDDEEKLALGIDPDEVLEYIGTREDLIIKFQNDIPKFSSRSDAEKEVDKFLMDGEMLDMYIKYSQRKKEDPDWEPMYAQQEDASPVVQVVNFISQYAIWFAGAFLLKDFVTEYLDKNGGGGDAGAVVEGGSGSADVLVSSALDGIHQLTNTLV